MCGIVGYAGSSDATEHLINCLKILEYRGYDSSGLAVSKGDGEITIRKAKGKLSHLIDAIAGEAIPGTVGIGHTRWATQGIPSDINAHPHVDGHARVALVHNGTINNYAQLKSELEDEYAVKFVSDTDTEVLAHLAGVFLEAGMSLRDSVFEMVGRIKGSYAICVICRDEPGKILLACNETPLVIGIGKDRQLFCASDSAALLPYTSEVIRLRDHQVAELHRDGILMIFDSDRRQVISPQIQVLDVDQTAVDKSGYKHFLLKEINEQPNIIRNLLNSFYEDEWRLGLSQNLLQDMASCERVIVLGCGTAYYAGMIIKALLERFAKMPTQIEFASELISGPILADDKTLVVAISQSGETLDTLLAVKELLKAGVKLLAITNRPESNLASLTEGRNILTAAGVEVSVAATKSFTSQLICAYGLAFAMAKVKNSFPIEELNWLMTEARQIPPLMEQTLARADLYKSKIIPYANKEAFIFLGRGINYPIALEGALKMKEITYIQATGYAAGEMKHGPIATIDENVPTLSILQQGLSYHKILHNAIEAKTRGSPCLGIASDDDTEATRYMDAIFSVPQMWFGDERSHLRDLFSPFINVLPMQLAAYHLAEHLGKDVDQPRNLAKSVTVE